MSRQIITLNIFEWESDRLTYIQKIIPAIKFQKKERFRVMYNHYGLFG